MLEYQKIEHSNCYCRIGYIENRFEECERLTAPNREPFGERSSQYGAVNHINHVTLQEWGVATAFREKFGNRAVGAFVEN